MNTSELLTSIIVVNHNGLQHTRGLLRSITAHCSNFEAIVVDNGSSDGSLELLRSEFPKVQYVPLGRNHGFGSANNAGARVAEGEYLLLLNNDTLVQSDIVRELTSFLSKHPEAGVCGPRLLNVDGTLQISTGEFPSVLAEWRNRQRQYVAENSEGILQASLTVDWVTGAALMIRTSLFDRVGGFDERFFMYFEDIDLCRRVVDQGFQVCYVPETSVVHLGGNPDSESKPPAIQREYRASQLLYYSKHASALQRSLLRIYLRVKYGWRYIMGTASQRSVARMIYHRLGE